MGEVLHCCHWVTKEALLRLGVGWEVQGPGVIAVEAFGHRAIMLAQCPARGVEHGIETILTIIPRDPARMN